MPADIYYRVVVGRSRSMLRAPLLRGAARLVGSSRSRALGTSSPLSAIQLKMPSLSPTMEEGTIVKWHKVRGGSTAVNNQHIKSFESNFF